MYRGISDLSRIPGASRQVRQVGRNQDVTDRLWTKKVNFQ